MILCASPLQETKGQMASIKYVQCIGNLKENNVIYKLCPTNEFSTGVWQMAISCFCCETEEDINEFCNISSNSCVGQRISSSGQVETYEQPLGTVYLNLKKATTKKSINRFSFPLWLTINRISEEIHFNFQIAKNGRAISQDCQVILNVMFKRAQ